MYCLLLSLVLASPAPLTRLVVEPPDRVNNGVIADAVVVERRAGPFWGYGFGEVVITLLIVAAVVAIAYVIVRHMGIAIPPVVVQVGWIVALLVLGILAIRLVMSL